MSETLVHIVRERATPHMVRDMLQTLETYIKVAVDNCPVVREQVAAIVRRLLGGVVPA